ncbi:rhodanese-like domain-containing protein 10 [Solanum lycopersicum]|uniref:Rhodanese domain-containing protein n=1 Tax=Solanum lycopersicum TaxID=4081 RepID=A0A3Q7IJN6_SOLLC|nr:rhodanese-like domain-containing protein 10 [Solanum lycopersicum]
MALIQLQSSILKHNKHLQFPSFSTIPHQRSTILRISAVSPNAQQLIQSGKVRPVLPKEAGTAMEGEGYILLDIRPEWEREKACVSGSLHVPLFLKDMDNSPITLLKKWVHFGYIGLWTGQNFTMINDEFVKQVEQKIPDKDNAKVLVACGEGLRSLMAISKLHEGEYRNLAWLAGGFNRASDSDFPAVEGTEKLQYATIGGVSYYFLQLLILLQAVGKES